MYYDIYEGDVMKWAQEYSGEPFHALMLATSLDFGISNTVATIAKGDKVLYLVGLFVPLNSKPPKGLCMMHERSSTAAFLARIVIAFQRLAALGLPIRPAIITSTKILWMIQAMTVLIAAWAGAILAAALSLAQPTFIDLEIRIAVKTLSCRHVGFSWSRHYGSVLTFW